MMHLGLLHLELWKLKLIIVENYPFNLFLTKTFKLGQPCDLTCKVPLVQKVAGKESGLPCDLVQGNL